MAIEITPVHNPIITRFREYVTDRPDSWEDFPTGLIDDALYAIKAHAGEEIYMQGEDIGTDELFGALIDLFDEVGREAYNRYAADARTYFEDLRTYAAKTEPPTPTTPTTTVDNAVPRVRRDFITVFEVGQQMPTYVHRAHIVRFTPKADDAENSTFIVLTTGGMIHVHESTDEIFDMLGAGA